MDRPIIERIIEMIAQTYPGIDDDNFIGFEMDVDHEFENREEFRNYNIIKTSNPMSIIESRVEVTDSVPSLREVNGAIHDVWQMIQYEGVEVAALQNYKELAILRFATVSRFGGYYVSGTLRAEGARYRAIAKEWDQEHRGEHRGVYPELPHFE